MSRDVTQRFSDRVADYIKYRPGYPEAILALLTAECGLRSTSIIADIGSGTGILSELFLKHGNSVFGIEPNLEMREAAEALLAAYPDFTSVDGRAEATTLATASIDLVTAGQAAHWFNPAETHEELKRVLRADAWIAIIWNERRTVGPAFLEEYEHLLTEYGTDYSEVSMKYAEPEALITIFGGDQFVSKSFDSCQLFDFEGLTGRLASSSYAPKPGQSSYDPMMKELAAIFARHQENGRVSFEYDTKVFYGQIR